VVRLGDVVLGDLVEQSSLAVGRVDAERTMIGRSASP